jgi:AcrR family transcriptional regulator
MVEDMTTPRERRYERTRESILTAARNLIAERGADNVSLRAIARHVDYSPAGLYEYFGSKEEIIDELCYRGDAQLSEFLKRVPAEQPFGEMVVQLLEAYLDFARQNPEIYKVMFLQLKVGSSVVPEEFHSDDSFSILFRTIERGVNEGQFQGANDYSVFEISYSIWAMAHGMAMLQLSYLRDFDFDFDSANRKAIRVFLDGLQSPKT